jgi:predicted solute-binding protein
MDLSDAKTVALDVSSKTSVALTKIIFREFLGFEPQWTDAKPNLEAMLTNADCALLIGDPALTIDETKYRKFDLAETWKSYTGFGFVFAMWMTRAETLDIDLAAARDEGLLHADEIVANYRNEITLAPEDFKKYLMENISYTIDDSMHSGLELYFELAAKHSLVEENKPLNFLGN